MLTHKLLDISVADRRKDGGRIVISTGAADREKDRVFPQGAKLANYLKNPVVLWGHNYIAPEALIGRANTIEVTETGIIADFTLRSAASEADPQHIVLLLWADDFVRASSIGFMPESMVPNEMGGIDFVSWELLEFSLVPVPMNQDALRLAADMHPKAFAAYQKSGRVLSAANEKKLRAARDSLDEVLAQLAEDEDGKALLAEFRRMQTTLSAELASLSANVEQLAARSTPSPTPDDDAEARALLARLDHIRDSARRTR